MIAMIVSAKMLHFTVGDRSLNMQYLDWLRKVKQSSAKNCDTYGKRL